LTAVADGARLKFDAAREAVLSWNTFAENGLLEFRILRAHQPASEWLPFAEWNPDTRRSFSAAGDGVDVLTDIIKAELPFDGIDVRAPGVEFNLVSVATPVRNTPSMPYIGAPHILDVPAR